MRRPRHVPRRRPPWWPESEAWPPPDGEWPHHHFTVAKLGCFFVFVIIVIGAVLATAALGGLALAGGGLVPSQVAVAAAAVTVLALVMSAAMGGGVRRFAAPLDSMSEAARRLEAGDLTARAIEPRGGPGALQELVRSFNRMATRLEVDEQQRRTLLADVSHELRTPLAVLRGELEAIQDGVRQPDGQAIGLLLGEVDLLTRLVEDLRTVTLAEAGVLPLHREPTDVAVVLSEAAESALGPARDAGVRLDVDVPDELPLMEVDPFRIREVVTNLLSNAIRHTPTGGRVSLAARLDGAHLEVKVRDSGEGIDPELLPRIFERFTKGPASRGLGLGLPIAKSLVEAHGGSLRVDSRPTTGTTMTVRLPLAPL